MMSSMTAASASNQEQTKSILYQVDCCKASSGKTVSLTKRRVRWRFGTTNDSELNRGATGVDCRGCEHEITFSWSIASGKRLIIQDHEEIHYSQGKRAEGKFSFVWSAGGRMFTLVAYAATPVQKTHRSHGKQFELLIDNVPFDSLPRIYQLGNSLRSRGQMDIQNLSPQYSNASTSSRAAFAYPSYSSNRSIAPSPVAGERRTMQDEMTWARSVHIMETRRQMNATAGPGPNPRDSSRNIVEPSTSPGNSPVNTLASPIQDLISDFSTLDGPQDLLSNHPAPILNHDAFMPSVEQVDAFNPSTVSPTYDAIWSSIMDAYDNQPGSVSISDNYAPQTNAPEPVFSSVQQQQRQQQVLPSMQTLFVDTSESTMTPPLVSPTEVTEVDKAMHNLVNLDDISQSVFHSYTPTQTNSWEGKENVSLQDLKRNGERPKKQVMRTYHNDQQQHQQQHGSLVVYGQGQGLQHQGPPPLSHGYRY
jgi:hypothetical protein